jgi:hypothetical protein
MGHYSATNKSNIVSFSGKWKEKEIIMFSENTGLREANTTFSLMCTV